MAPANIFLALLDSASIAHDVAKLEALKANAKTEDARAPTSSSGEWRHPVPYGAQTASEPCILLLESATLRLSGSKAPFRFLF